MSDAINSTSFCTRCATVDGCVCPVPVKKPRKFPAAFHRRKSAEVEREACIRILEDMRPRNDQSDWNEFTVTTDTILRLAIEAISRRYPT